MTCPLQTLHIAFSTALKDHTYVGLSKEAPAKLESTQVKTIRLAEVFKKARYQIEEALKEKSPIKENEFAHLKNLEHDGTLIYERYKASTNSWSRFFMKCVARYTPELLKKILPSCFSNGIEKAEKKTFEEYQQYLDFLKLQTPNSDKDSDKIAEKALDEEEVFDAEEDNLPNGDDPKKEKGADNGSQKKESGNPKTPISPPKNEEKIPLGLKSEFEDDDEDDEFLQQILAQTFSENLSLSKSDKETKTVPPKKDDESKPEKETPQPKTTLIKQLQFATIPADENKNKLEEVDLLSKAFDLCLQQLTQFNERPLTLAKFRNLLGELCRKANALTQLTPEGTQALEKCGLSEEVLAILKDAHLLASLMTGNHEKILDALSSTPWKNSFEEAVDLAQDGKQINFGVQKLGGSNTIRLDNGKGARFKEKDFQTFRGKVRVTVSDITSLNEMKELVNFLEKNEKCCPNSIVITLMEGQELNAECVQLLLKLKRVSEIQINGVKEINFKNIGLSESEELGFVQHLGNFSFPQLENIILSDQTKTDWTAANFSNLLSLCPSFELLKTCYQQCSTYQDISIPQQLQKIQLFDTHGFDSDQITHLLNQFHDLVHIDFADLKMDDTQLFDLLDHPNLLQLKSLDLKGCQSLTTDALFTLVQLPQLANLSLPDLIQGEIRLDLLPKFDNPLKIKLFYLASQLTRKNANQLYTGPQNWSAIFQIPLARLGEEKIFPSDQKRLDPKNVAYWLHDQDYTSLKAHEGIVTILADFNAKMNDDNIVEFMQKFPKVKTLSLYDCPNVTEKGIIALLQAHPMIETLDLTNCRITDALLLDEGNFNLLKKMKQIIVNGTGISSDLVELFKEQDVKLSFEQTTLKITDADITTDQALEELLKGENLTQFKTIDLSDCLTLTNDMLGLLLDHLNTDTVIKTAEGDLVSNPQRLNAAVINIKGCVKITDEAFVVKTEENEDSSEASKSKKDLKLLESLDRMVIGETMIPSLINDLYPKVTFQKDDEPITIQIDPELQLKECALYHALKIKNFLNDSDKGQLKELGKRYIHNRITAELFYKNNEGTLPVILESIDIHSTDFSDISLSFMADETSAATEFHAHRDVLYSQSRYFINGLRPGGEMNKNENLSFVNVHATPEAAAAIMKLFYGKLSINDLNWQTAADVAELISLKNFKLSPLHYQQFLKHIHAQFTLENADELLTVAEKLDDKIGKEEYEGTLAIFLDSLDMKDQETFQTISNLAKSHGLKTLQKKVELIEEAKNNEIINKALAEQHAYDELLSQLVLEE